MLRAYRGAAIHDGETLRTGHVLLVEDGITRGLVSAGDVPAMAEAIDLPGGVICPGFVDLQVNGGGGVMLGDAPGVGTLRRIARAHAVTGTTSFLPTLITDTPDKTAEAIEAACAACAQGLEGIAGLHLEGPHLSPARKGAHDPSLIRPMEASDLDLLCHAASRLPNLMVTVAPEAVTDAQIASLAAAGAIVSLGHTDADYETCKAAMRAGARAVTHLFNAMSQLGSRAPGLVGAALDTPGTAIGLIADGFHVHEAAIRLAMAARPDALFLVTDAMAIAGTDIPDFRLNGRRITRARGCLTLADGTLAGADLDMPRALRTMVGAGTPLETAIAMATSRPARLLRAPAGAGRIRPGHPFRAVHLARETWRVRPL